jgi:hypothetical protein
MVGAQESAVVNGSIYVTHPVVLADWDYLSGGQSSESGFFGESGRAVREGGGGMYLKAVGPAVDIVKGDTMGMFLRTTVSSCASEGEGGGEEHLGPWCQASEQDAVKTLRDLRHRRH